MFSLVHSHRFSVAKHTLATDKQLRRKIHQLKNMILTLEINYTSHSSGHNEGQAPSDADGNDSSGSGNSVHKASSKVIRQVAIDTYGRNSSFKSV